MRHTLPNPPAWWGPGPDRAVYLVHCFTATRAQEIKGAQPNVTRAPQPVNHWRFTFRAKPQYRTPAARQVRAMVAASIVRERRA
jgi:hypothetical protein